MLNSMRRASSQQHHGPQPLRRGVLAAGLRQHSQGSQGLRVCKGQRAFQGAPISQAQRPRGCAEKGAGEEAKSRKLTPALQRSPGILHGGPLKNERDSFVCAFIEHFTTDQESGE